MNVKTTIRIAALSGALAVALGAFGAHGLAAILEANNRVETFETAVQYHMFHTVLLLFLGLLQFKFPDTKFISISAWCAIGGILVFSGSLYVLSLTNITILGAITPIGGILFIASWMMLAFGVRKFL